MDRIRIEDIAPVEKDIKINRFVFASIFMLLKNAENFEFSLFPRIFGRKKATQKDVATKDIRIKPRRIGSLREKINIEKCKTRIIQ